MKDVLSQEEYESALSRIKNEFIPYLKSKIDDLESNYYDPDEAPSDYFDDLRFKLTELDDVFEESEITQALEYADLLVDKAIDRLDEENAEREEEKKKQKKEEEEKKFG